MAGFCYNPSMRPPSRMLCNFSILSLCLIVTGCLGPQSDERSLASRPMRSFKALRLKATVYYLALESDYSTSDKDGLFLDSDGKILYRGSREFREKAGIEGSAKLLDGAVLNYHSRVKGEVRWVEVKVPYGLGVRCPLVPMRSVAVDPAVIPLNSVIHIPKTEGLLLPDGSRHDGIWYAHDAGQAIKGNRIDLFAGAGMESMKRISAGEIGNLTPLRATIAGIKKGCRAY